MPHDRRSSLARGAVRRCRPHVRRCPVSRVAQAEEVREGAAWLDGVNPVAKVLMAVVLAVPLLVTLDAVSASTALVLELLCVPLTGLSYAVVLRRLVPVLVFAPVAAISMLLYARPEGTVYGTFLFATVSDASIALSVAVLLRVIVLALPMILLFARTDPTALADALAQVAKLPSRFVLGCSRGPGRWGSSSTTGARWVSPGARAASAIAARYDGSSRWRSCCSCSRCAAERSSPRRWRLGASAPTSSARGLVLRPSRPGMPSPSGDRRCSSPRRSVRRWRRGRSGWWAHKNKIFIKVWRAGGPSHHAGALDEERAPPMKRTRTLGILGLAVAAVCAATVVPPPTAAEAFQPSTRASVIQYLTSLTGNGIVSGQHNKEPASQPAQYTQQVKDITGSTRAVGRRPVLHPDRRRQPSARRRSSQNGVAQRLARDDRWHACPPTGPSTCAFDGG